MLSRIDVHHGATGVLPKQFADALFTNEFIIFDPAPTLNAVCLQVLLRQPYYRLETRGEASGSTGRKRFSHSDLPKIRVPILPRPIQDRIFEAYEENLSEVRALQRDINRARAQAQVKILQALKLEPAILRICTRRRRAAVLLVVCLASEPSPERRASRKSFSCRTLQCYLLWLVGRLQGG